MLSLKRGAKYLALLAGSALCGPVLAAQLQILQLERIEPTASVQPQSAAGRGASGVHRLRFDTGARRYELLLEPNTTLLPRGTTAGVEALRGTVAGAPGSWVRVVRRAGRYSGLFFDGHQFYAIGRAAAAAPSSRQAADMDPDATVIYRLSDTLVTGALFEGDTVDASRSGTAAFENLADTLAPETAQAVLTTRRLDVGVVIDAELAALDGSAAEANAIERMNIVDEIFSTQVGVHLQVLSVTILDGATQPFSSTTIPGTLLEELSTYRRNSAEQQSTGLTHLFTGRNLDGSTVGIAYTSPGICSDAFAASLSEARTAPAFAALIAAHEIGHTFSAPHDGDAGGACAAEAPGFLMAPSVSGNDQFSPCSLQQIANRVATASCLAPLDAADATLGAALTADLALNQSTTIAFSVRSVGNVAVNDVVVEVVLPASVTAVGAGAVGGSCELSAGPTSDVIVCRLGSLDPGQTRAIEMSLLSSTTGRANANITLTASNDGLSQNNTSTLRLDTSPGADLTVSIVADDQNLVIGDTATATITLRNLGLASANNSLLTAAFPAGLVPTSLTTTGITCTQTATGFTCTPQEIASGAQATVVVGVRATAVGSQRLALNFVSSAPDPQPGNNDAGATFTVVNVAPPPVTPVESGGGGGLGLPLLGWLAACGWFGYRRAQTRRRSL